MTDLNLTKLSIVFIILMALFACAGQSGEPFETKHNLYQLTGIAKLDERQRADLYEAIIAADMAEYQQDHLTAMSYYLFAAELSRNEQLIDKSIESAISAKDPLGLERAANIWLSVSPNNKHALGILLEAQLELQNLEGAIETAIKLLKIAQNSEEKISLLKNRVISKEPRIAFVLLRELNELDPKDPAIIAAQAQFIFNLANANKQSDNTLKQALSRSEDALAIDPLLITAIRIKTLALFQLREDALARSYLSNLFIENPKSKAISQMLGQLLYDLQDYDASVLHYANWLEHHPKDLDARNYLAASYYALGQYELSLKHFKGLLEKNYQPQTTAFYCGDSAQKSGNIEFAIACFKRVNAGRYLALSRIQLAKLLINKHEYQQALAVLRAPYSLGENDLAKLVTAEIDLLHKYISADEAKQRLEEALQKSPDNLPLLLKKIEIDQLLDKPKKLNELLAKARDLLQPGQRLNRFNLAAAALFKNNGHYQQSIDWLNQAIENNPEDKDLLYTRALYKEPLGLYREMVEEFEYLVAAFPDDLNIKNALGFTLADMGEQLDYAQALIDSAYQGMPNNAAVIDSKGWIAYRKGDLATAMEYLDRAFRLSPSAEGAAHLGEVLWRKSQHQEAEVVWRKGMQIDKENHVLLKTLERLKVELD